MIRIILVIFLILSGCEIFESSEQDHLNRATRHLESGDLRSSALELKSALQKNPENFKTRFLLAKLYIDMNDGAAAEKELNAYLVSGGARNDMEVLLGQALLLQNEFDRLLNELPSQPDFDKQAIYALRGQGYLGLKRLDLAEKAFQDALKIAPGFYPAVFGEARLALMAGKLEDAKQLIDQALKLSPKSGEALSLSGDIIVAKGNLLDAERAYSDAIVQRFDKTKALFK